MKTKFMNWLEKHELICAVVLLFISFGAIVFGGACMGGEATPQNVDTVISVIGPDGMVHTILTK